MDERQVIKGIVLRETLTKETDKILTVLTAELGRIAIIARGARRKNSPLAAASELLAYAEFVVSEQKGWLILKEASTIELWNRIRADVELLALASYFAEMTETVTGAEIPAEQTLSALLNSLYALNTLGKQVEQVKGAFELKLLALSGYEPQVWECAVCGTSAPADPLLEIQQGVVYCRSCAGKLPKYGNLVSLDPGSLAAMRHVIRAEQKRMLAFSLNGEALTRFSHACESFSRVQLERDFQTLAFYHSLRKLLQPSYNRYSAHTMVTEPG